MLNRLVGIHAGHLRLRLGATLGKRWTAVDALLRLRHGAEPTRRATILRAGPRAFGLGVDRPLEHDRAHGLAVDDLDASIVLWNAGHAQGRRGFYR